MGTTWVPGPAGAFRASNRGLAAIVSSYKVTFVDDNELPDDFHLTVRVDGTTQIFLRDELRRMPAADMASVLEEVLAGQALMSEDADVTGPAGPRQDSSSETASP